MSHFQYLLLILIKRWKRFEKWFFFSCFEREELKGKIRIWFFLFEKREVIKNHRFFFFVFVFFFVCDRVC